MKKIFALLLSGILVLLFASCNDGGYSMDAVLSIEHSGCKIRADSYHGIDLQEENIAEHVIFDELNIRITATGFDDSGVLGPAVKVFLENNTERDITVQVRDTSVNDFMACAMFSANIAAGQKVQDKIMILSSGLEEIGITALKEVEFSLHIMDSETWDTVADTGRIVLRTAADASETYDTCGHVACDADGVKVVIRAKNPSGDFWGTTVWLYLENNTDNDITVEAKNVSVNGLPMKQAFTCEIKRGKKAVDSMLFMKSALVDHGIAEITELTLQLHIVDANTRELIMETERMNIRFD